MPIALQEKVKKNLLDLQFTKNLQYFNTSVIVLVTYLISVGVVFITKQIDYTNVGQLLLVIIFSIAVISVDVIFMLRFKSHMNNILKEIKKLDLS